MTINTFVPPDITNATLWPEPTNAATNYRNQSTAQFASITNQLNTEVRDKVNEHLADTTQYWQAVMTASTQSIASGVETAIDITESIANANVSLAANQVTILESGNYDIDIRVYCDTVAAGAGNSKLISINKNGIAIATNLIACDVVGSPGNVMTLRLTATLVTNNIIVFAAKSTPGNTLASGTNKYSSFTIRRIG